MQTLRLGICSCATFYHGQFHDSTVELRNGRLFRIKEVIVPENDHFQTLRSKRCHFFLDTHRHVEDRGWETVLDRITILPRGENLLYWGVRYGDGVKINRPRRAHHKRVRTAMVNLLNRLPEPVLDLWVKLQE